MSDHWGSLSRLNFASSNRVRLFKIISSGLRLVKPILLVILVGNMQLLGLQRSVVFGPTVTKPSYGVPQPLWKDELHRLAISCHAYCCSQVQMEDPDQLPYHSARRADGEVTCQF